MINSRDINDLLPRVADKAREFVAACLDEGIHVTITSTYRDNESQDAIYAEGRTKPGTIKTKAKGGDSFHNYRVAFDFVPVMDGKAVWGDRSLWERCGAIAVRCGLEWGGSWEHFKDMPHCQDTAGYTLADYKAGQAPYLA